MVPSELPLETPVLDSPRRLEALLSTDLLDTPPEECFDRATHLASLVLNTPVSTMTLVDVHRQFFKSQVGLRPSLAEKRETPLSHSFCQYLVGRDAPLVVSDARKHPTLRTNAALRDYDVVAYLGVPLTLHEGGTLGALCVIDDKPRPWSERDIRILEALAETVVTEIRLRILAREFQANYLALRVAEIRRDEMVHMLVHDLRNPLGALSVMLQLLSSGGALNEEQQRSVDVAVESSDEMLAMVSDILDVSKAEAGKMALNLAATNARDLLQRSAERVAASAEARHIALDIHVSPQTPDVCLDAEKVRRVLVNLISNAVQHSPKGSTVALRASVNDQWIVFEVQDSGCGIARDSCRQIFEKFGRSAHTVGRSSTGLGLPFCKMAVEAHGGEITVESELKVGTTFRFTIPRTLKPDQPAADRTDDKS